MLVLTRKESEVIHIGDDIRVMVIGTGKTVRIGIDAPEELRIFRGEHCRATVGDDSEPPERE